MRCDRSSVRNDDCATTGRRNRSEPLALATEVRGGTRSVSGGEVDGLPSLLIPDSTAGAPRKKIEVSYRTVLTGFFSCQVVRQRT